MIEWLLESLEHDDHYFEIDYKGSEYKICSRCTGSSLGMISGFIFSIYFLFFKDVTFTFFSVFITSWLLSIPLILDWGLTKLSRWKSHNIVRAGTGFLLGNAVSIYLLLLPLPFHLGISLLVKIFSVSLFSFSIFWVIKFSEAIRKDHSINSLLQDDRRRKLRGISSDKGAITINCCFFCPESCFEYSEYPRFWGCYCCCSLLLLSLCGVVSKSNLRLTRSEEDKDREETDG